MQLQQGLLRLVLLVLELEHAVAFFVGSRVSQNARNERIFSRGSLQKPVVAVSMQAASLDDSFLVSSSQFPVSLIENPVTWSVLIMLTIVGLLLTWETLIGEAREKTPPAVRVVIDRILSEMGGLGFIGILLSTLLNKQVGLGDAMAGLSEHFLGDEEILIESFEFLHEVFFQAAIVYFATVSFMIVRMLETITQITTITEETIRRASLAEAPDRAVQETLADVLGSQTLPAKDAAVNEKGLPMEEYEAMLCLEDARQSTPPWVREVSLSLEERGAEILVIRERLIREMSLPKTFKIQTYLERVFAQNKLDVVDISPASWVPLIPALAFANAVDLSHDVVNSQSANAAESSGYFFSTPWVILPSVALQFLATAWSLFNFWKMAGIKAMLVPTLVRDEADGGRPRVVGPAVENPELRRNFQSTPALLRPLEAAFAKPATNRVEELFGTIGGAGPDFYLKSIKFSCWLSTTSLIVYASQILPRDIDALLDPTVVVGDPEHLVPEILTYGAFALLNIAQLSIAGITFLNYCLVTCVEDLVSESDVACAILDELKEGAPQTAIEEAV